MDYGDLIVSLVIGPKEPLVDGLMRRDIYQYPYIEITQKALHSF